MTHPMLKPLHRVLIIVGLFAIHAGCGRADPSQAPPAANIATDNFAETESANSVAAVGTTDVVQKQNVQVIMTTSQGTVIIQLNAEKAPSTVANFLEYVQREHYDQTIFHYVQEGLMILGGGYTEDGTARSMRAEITSEAHNELSNRRGTIAMARDQDYEHSATCQFFFNLSDNMKFDHTGRDTPQDYGYCVFGEVVQGLDVLDQIAVVAVHDTDQFTSTPRTPVVIETIRQVSRR